MSWTAPFVDPFSHGSGDRSARWEPSIAGPKATVAHTYLLPYGDVLSLQSLEQLHPQPGTCVAGAKPTDHSRGALSTSWVCSK